MAGRQTVHKLTDRKVRSAPPGTHEDGAGLRLVVGPNGSKRWSIRLTISGRRHQKGLGSFPIVSLQSARERAMDFRRAAAHGRDLAAELRAKKTDSITFAAAFEQFFQSKQKSLSNGKHVTQWTRTIQTYVLPFIGNRPVADIDASEIINLLKPIWHEKPETAARVLQRIEATFQSAIVLGHRERASPCIGIAQHLGQHHRSPSHHVALPYSDVAGFIGQLRGSERSRSLALALEFLILTAARSGEVRGATWDEIDFNNACWVVPTTRLKTGRTRMSPHRVPLSSRCLEILRQAEALSGGVALVFPGTKKGKPISENSFVKCIRSLGYSSATAHGFRTSFKVWCAEQKMCRDQVSEAALAHVIADKVKAAYLRTDFFEERRQLMQAWTDFATQISGLKGR